jgi:hypothetical protein
MINVYKRGRAGAALGECKWLAEGGRFRGNRRWGVNEIQHQYRPNWMQIGVDCGLDLEESIDRNGGTVYQEHLAVGPVEMHSVVDAVENCRPYGDNWKWQAFAEEWRPAFDEESLHLRRLYERACAANGIDPLPVDDPRSWRERQAELDQKSGAVVNAIARLAAAEVTRG